MNSRMHPLWISTSYSTDVIYGAKLTYTSSFVAKVTAVKCKVSWLTGQLGMLPYFLTQTWDTRNPNQAGP